ncbi:MAG: hypothetical protein ACRC80_22710, partial [Waterburya sp.]
EGQSSNDIYQLVKHRENRWTHNWQVGGNIGSSPTGTEMPKEVAAINQLYDALDRTVMVGSHQETSSESDRIPEDGTLLALNPNTDNSTTPVNEDNQDPEPPYNLTF